MIYNEDDHNEDDRCNTDDDDPLMLRLGNLVTAVMVIMNNYNGNSNNESADNDARR